jgi:hypothetical protein
LALLGCKHEANQPKDPNQPNKPNKPSKPHAGFYKIQRETGALRQASVSLELLRAKHPDARGSLRPGLTDEDRDRHPADQLCACIGNQHDAFDAGRKLVIHDQLGLDGQRHAG